MDVSQLIDIRYEVADGVGVITLDRPQYRNAQGYRMLDEIDAVFRAARHDDAVRVLVVRVLRVRVWVWCGRRYRRCYRWF